MLGTLFLEMLALLGIIILGGGILIATVIGIGASYLIIKGFFEVGKVNKKKEDKKDDLS